MKYRRYDTAIDLINITMQFILFYLMITILLHFFDSNAALHALRFLPAPFLSYGIRKYTHHVWSFLLLHLILLALYWITANRIEILVAGMIYLTLLMILAYYEKHRSKEPANTSIYFLLLILALYLCCYFLKVPDLQQLCFLLGIIYFLLYMVSRYLLNLNKFIKDHAHIAGVPYQQIKGSNNVLASFLLGLILLAMLLFSLFPLGKAVLTVGNQFLRFIRYLFSFLPNSTPEEIQQPILPQPQENTMDQLPASDPSRFMELLAQVFQWIAIAALIAGAIFLVFYCVYRIYRYFYLKGEEAEDSVEFISPFIKKERLKRDPVSIFRTLLGKSNNELIRKQFVKAVTSHLGSGSKLSKNMTPTQLSEYAVGIGKPSDFLAPEEEKRKILLTEYYEKARYGKDDCTKEEVQLVKDITKRGIAKKQ